MTKEDLMKITDPNVGIKVLDIMFNSFEVVFEKEFGNNFLEAKIMSCWYKSTCIVVSGFQEKFILPKYLCNLNIKLNDWAVCRINLGYDIKENIENIKYIWLFEKLSGQKRLDELKKRCENRKLEYEIIYDKDKLFSNVFSKLFEIGKGFFKITKFARYSQKVNFSVNFDCTSILRKEPVTFQIFFSELDDFLECLQNFVDVCKEKKLNKLKEIQNEFEVMPLREFRLVTKKVLYKFLRKNGGINTLQKNLELGKLGKKFKTKLFAGNHSLEYVCLPPGMKEIPESLFMFCENLRSVQIPDSVENIGTKAFYGCKNLKNVNLPEHLKAICSKAFANCDSLPKLNAPEECIVSSDAFVMESYDDSKPKKKNKKIRYSNYLNKYNDSGNWYRL